MEFGNAIKSGFSKYAQFSGVASRSEFWYWVLFSQLVSIGLQIIQDVLASNTVGMNPSNMGGGTWMNQLYAPGLAGALSGLWGLAVFIPTLSVSARRLRDAGKSPQLLWLYLVPFGSAIIASIGLLGYAFGNPQFFCVADYYCHLNGANPNYSGWMVALVVLAVIALIALAVGVLFLIWYVQPSKSAEQGNRYLAAAAPEQPSVLDSTEL